MSATALSSYRNCMFQKLAPGLADSDTGFIEDGNREGGSFGTLNIEELAKIDPDLVIIYKRDVDAMLSSLETVGIPTIVVDYGDIDLLRQGLLVLGQAMGDEDSQRAQMIVDWINDGTSLVDQRIGDMSDSDRPSALLLRDGNLGLYNSTFSDNMIKEAGGRVLTNSVAGSTSGSTIDFEQIQQWDPDYILLGNFADHKPEDIYTNTMAGMDWSHLKAVQNRHVYKMPMGLYRWDPPSTEAHLALFWEAKMFHPEMFSDIDLVGRTREFYQNLFNYSLTQDDLDMIFHADLNSNSESIF